MDQGDIAQPRALSRAPGFLSGQRKLYIAVALLVIALVYFAFIVFQGAATFYFTVGELTGGGAQPGQRVRVSGKLVQDSFQREGPGILARFSITDGQQALPAVYEGMVPELFFNPESEIVLEGYYEGDGVFQVTTTPIVKCPSKYQALASESRASPP